MYQKGNKVSSTLTTPKDSISRNPSQKFKSVEILGVRVHNVTMVDTLRLLTEMVLSNKPHHVVTVNPEFIMVAQHNKVFKLVLNNAALAIPDGAGVLWASRKLGMPIAERVTGVDTVRRISAIAREKNLNMFLLGGAPGVAEKASAELQRENPGLNIVGTYAGSPDISEEAVICERIRTARPHILLVAYGSPRQDLWIDRNLVKLETPVAIGVGGTFDFITGKVPRAPQWMRERNIEWLYRLWLEPWRWRRMTALPRFIVRVLREKKKESKKDKL